MRTSIIFAVVLMTIAAQAKSSFDKTSELNGVLLNSGKEESTRSFHALTEITLPYSMKHVKMAITNFTEKCNNAFRGLRKYTPKGQHCKYHNESIIESFIVEGVKSSEIGPTQFFLMGRQIYNRGNYGHYDSVTFEEGINSQKQNTLLITVKMLNDSEVRAYTSPKFERESPFDSSIATYFLTAESPEVTHVKFVSEAKTDHWLLNKEITVPQVFASISKSINDNIKTVVDEADFQKKRELALTSEE